MWISSFLVTLPASEEAAESICSALDSAGVFTSGERQGRRLPVVLEAPDGSASRHWHEWIENLPGVCHVEVVFVGFDEAETFAGLM